MDWPPIIAIFIMGTAIGSFINVLIYRLPREESIIRPRSYCPECKSIIPWYRNVPLLSFVLQRGRCAECGRPISMQYPFVEVSAGIIWTACFMNFLPLKALFLALFLSLLIALAWIDYLIMMIPFSLIVAGIILVVFGIILEVLDLMSAFWGSIAGVSIPLVMMGITYMITHRQGMGWGDVQLGLILGAWLGPVQIIFTLFLAAALGLLAWLGISTKQGFDKNRPLPFAPYLVISAIAILFLDPQTGLWIDKFLLL